jgi:TRAP transporter TAXI family solute receptor
MGKEKGCRYFIIVVTAVFLVTGIWAIKGEAQIRRISIGTADTGGVYYIYGGGIAKVISGNIPNTIATAEVTPGAVDNVKMLQNQSLDFAFTKSDVAAEAIKGVGPFASTGKFPVRAIAVLYSDIAHVVAVSSGINKLEDMKGKRISTSAPGSGHEMVALKLLEAAGVNPLKDFKRERISLSESANAFKDRKIDGFFFATGLPAASMLDLGATPGLTFKLLDVQSYLSAIIRKHGRIYNEDIIPKGTYSKQEEDVKTISVPVVFVTPDTMDEKLVYAITKILFEKKSDLVAVHKEAKKLILASAIALAEVPFHPGAIKYYQEQGVWK